MDITFVTTETERNEYKHAIEECDTPKHMQKAKRKVWVDLKVAGRGEVGQGTPRYLVVDNREGDAWTEDFDTLDGAMMYALDHKLTSLHQHLWDVEGRMKKEKTFFPPEEGEAKD